jgi:hypothetical protein
MTETLKKDALQLLKIQYDYIKFERRNGKIQPIKTIANERQDAYYMGMRTMLEFLLTNGYTKEGAIIRKLYGEHEFNENNF